MNVVKDTTPEDYISELSKAKIEARTLQEILKIDFGVLLSVVAPHMTQPDFGRSGISTKMSLAGAALFDHLSRHYPVD